MLKRGRLLRFIRALSPGILAIGSGCWTTVQAQVLETETARLPARGSWEVGGNYEYQKSSDGRESAFPWAIQYGLRDTWELLVEPVASTAIRSAGASRVSGSGDLEITLTHLFRKDSGSRWPALAWAAEVKVPTGKKPLIGTGEYDYTGYLIASKRFGKFDLHANLSYTMIGNPPGANLEDVFGVAVGTVYRPNPNYEVFGEVLATSASGGGEQNTSAGAIVPEAAGGETVVTVGAGRFFRSNLLGFISIGTDNNAAHQARVGFTISF